jgi:hypothetical protein
LIVWLPGIGEWPWQAGFRGQMGTETTEKSTPVGGEAPMSPRIRVAWRR